MPLVHVEHGGPLAQGLEQPDAADAEEHLLRNPDAIVAAVEALAHRAGLVRCAVDVRVQEVEAHAADLHLPGARPHLAALERDGDREGRTVRPGHRREREIARLVVAVDRELASVGERLIEESLVVEEPHRAQIEREIGSAPDVVARQHTEASGVDRKRRVEPELHAEVRHGGTARRGAIGVRAVPVGEQPLRAPPPVRGRILRADATQEEERVVPDLFPRGGIEIAEQLVGFRARRPPKIEDQIDEGVGHGALV